MRTLVQRVTRDIGGETQIKSGREPCSQKLSQVLSTVPAKVLGQDGAWCAAGMVRRLVWLEQSEWWRRGKGGLMENFVFYSRGVKFSPAEQTVNKPTSLSPQGVCVWGLNNTPISPLGQSLVVPALPEQPPETCALFLAGVTVTP